MPRGLRILLAAIVTLITPHSAMAGDPWVPDSHCEQVNSIYRVSMMLYQTHPFGPLCGVRVGPAFYQTPTEKVLGGSAPPSFTALVDTAAGTVVFSLTPCDTNWNNAGPFTMAVASFPTWLHCDLLSTGGNPVEGNDVYFTCATVPALRRSWGDLKLHYR